jgi:hypothetical protein
MNEKATKDYLVLHMNLTKQLWDLLQEHDGPDKEDKALIGGVIAGVMVEWMIHRKLSAEEAIAELQMHASATAMMFDATNKFQSVIRQRQALN